MPLQDSPAHHVELFAQAGHPTATPAVHHGRDGHPAVRPRAVALALTVDREQRAATCRQHRHFEALGYIKRVARTAEVRMVVLLVLFMAGE